MEGAFLNAQQDSGAVSVTPISWSSAHETHQGSALSLPDGADFLRADFSRSGPDLLIETPSGDHFVITSYFTFLAPPALETADGAILNAGLVAKLAGPVAPAMTAQNAGLGFSNLGEPIGQINEGAGSISVTHADGNRGVLTLGDSIFQGDVLETGPKANVSVVFVDDTIFTLDAGGRMVMDEMVYDAETQTGIFSAQVVQGVFSFVSGKVAKTSLDGMVVATPTNTIGIRGSTVLGEAAQEGAANKITLISDIDGNVGELVISNGAGTMTLSQPGASTTVFSASAAPTPFTILSPQDIQQSYGSTLTNLVKSVAKKADQDTQEAARKAQQADQETVQAQEQAQQAEDQAVQADEQAQQADVEAEAALAEADVAKAEAEAMAAEVEALKAASDPKAEAMAAALEAKTAEVDAKVVAAEAKAAAAAEAQVQAEEAAVQAEVQIQAAAQAEQQAVQANATVEQLSQYSSMAQSAAVIQEQVYTQFVETGVVDPTYVAGVASDVAPVIDTQTSAIDQAAQTASDQAIAAGATPEEAAAAGFAAAKEQALAEGATPEEIAAAEQAYNDAIAAGLSPEEAMAAAGAAGQQAGLQPGQDPALTGQPPVDAAGQVVQAGTTPDQQQIDAAAQAYDAAIAAGLSPAEAELAVQAKMAEMGIPIGPVDGGLNGGMAPGTVMSDGTVVPGGSGSFIGGYFGPNGSQTGGGYPFDMGGTMDMFGMGGVIDPFYMGGLGPMDMYGFNPIQFYDFNFYDPNAFIDPYGTYLPDPNRTNSTFFEVLNATVGDDHLYGSDGATQFVMQFGVTLGGYDIVDGGLGTDEVAFTYLENSLFVYDSATAIGQYSSSDGLVSGTVTFNSIEQIYADDGVGSFSDASGTSVQLNTSGVRLAFGANDTGIGYIVAGTDAGNDTITLADSTTLTYSGLSNTVTNGSILGSIVFGKGGNDILTGTSADDIIYGGLGNDTLDGGGGTNGDSLFGGAGTDSLTGGTANDDLYGGAGIDTLIGGGGQDVLNGGAGADIFRYSATTDGGAAGDFIKDFSGSTAFGGATGDGDVLQFATAAFGIGTVAYEEIAWGGTSTGLTLTNAAANVIVLTGGVGGTLTNALTAFAAGNTTATNAVFVFNDSDINNVGSVYYSGGLNTGTVGSTVGVFSGVTVDLVDLAAADFGVV